MLRTASAIVFFLSFPGVQLSATVVTVLNGFTTFPNRFVADIGNTNQFPLPLGADNVLGPFTVGGVTITSGNAPFIAGIYFASAATGGGGEINTPDIPGNVGGAVVSNNSGFFQNALPDLVLNFSRPINGFGATFLHDISGLPAQLNSSGPATVSVFTGLNGTGTLLGSETDKGGVNLLDFIGVLDDTPAIQSAVLSSSGPFGAFQVDAYGLSAAPVANAAVPEPASGNLITAAVSFCLFNLKRMKRLSSGVAQKNG
jgi:hypothetical protein